MAEGKKVSGNSPATNISKKYGGKQAPVVKQGQTKGTRYGMNPDVAKPRRTAKD